MSEPEKAPETPPRDPLDLGPVGDLPPGATAWVPHAAAAGEGVDPHAPARLMPGPEGGVRVQRVGVGVRVTDRQGTPPRPANPTPPDTTPKPEG